MLHIITGPPASGKTTYVAEHAQPGDIRIDLDHLANLLAGVDVDNHDHPGHVLAVARAARAAAIDAALTHADEHDVWIIDSSPTAKNLELYRKHGAEIHTIDPGKSVVMTRVKQGRPSKMLQVAAAWYDRQPGAVVVKSFAYGGRARPRGLVLDARGLPNPHAVPALRMLNGRSGRVVEWLEQQPDVEAFIDAALRRVERTAPSEVWVGCSAGKHRSVYVADRIAEHLGVEAVHTALEGGKTTTERGYGWANHQKPREKLLRRHRDGTPCPECGKPMYKEAARNWDGAALEADHPPGATQKYAANKQKNPPRRLLHRHCNRSGGAWEREPKVEPAGGEFDLSGLVID